MHRQWLGALSHTMVSGRVKDGKGNACFLDLVTVHNASNYLTDVSVPNKQLFYMFYRYIDKEKVG